MGKVIKKATIEIIRQFSKAVKQFFLEDELRFGQQWPPFWIAAENGNRLLCQHIFERTGKISPNGLFGMNNALHMVAKKRNVEVCKFIVNTELLQRKIVP